MPALLLVDDEASVVAALRRSLRMLHANWNILTATSGEDALALMDECRFDVIISDMRMPGMDGGQLLTEVSERWPSTIRLILSGHTGNEALVRSIGPAHQFLAKPCDPSTIGSTVENMLAVRDRLSDDRMIPILGTVQTLPKRPAIYNEFLAALADSSTKTASIAKIIDRDVALTARVLRLANSPFFGASGNINSVERAIAYIGLDTLQGIVIGSHAIRAVDQSGGVDLEQVWNHSLRVAAMMRAIALSDRMPVEDVGQLFLCGLLHSIGLLVLATAQSDRFRELGTVRADVAVDVAADHEAFGCTRFEAGAYLLALWGFPHALVEAISRQPAMDATSCIAAALTTALHVASGASAPPIELTMDAEKRDRWFEVCQDAMAKEA